MKRVSDFFVLALQVFLGYLLVHFATPWTQTLSIRIIAFLGFISAGYIGLKALADLGNSFAVSPTPHKTSTFVAKGIYSQVRHPMYLSVLLGASSLVLIGFNSKSLGVYSVIIIFFAIKIKVEEKALNDKYPEYSSYASKTGILIPKLKSQ